MALQTRAEAQERFTWDFTDIFENDAAWEAAYAEAEQEIDAIPALSGTLGESAESMKKGLDAIVSAQAKAERIYIYAMLRKNVDNGDPTYQALSGRSMNLMVKLSTNCAFLNPEILSVPADKLAEMMDSPLLSGYRHILEDTDRMRAHTLDENSEKLLAMLSDATGATSDCYDMLAEVDMTFPNITGEDGQPATLTHGNFGVYRESSDQRVRKESFETYFGEYKKYINT